MNEKSERHETTDESAVPPRDPTFVPPSKQRRTEVSEEDLLDRLVDTQELTETLKAQALARLLETDGIIESTAPPSGEGEDSKRERTDHAQSRAEALERIAAQLAEAQGGTCDDEKARRRSTSPPPQGGKGQEVASPAQPSSVPPKGRAAARARILQRSAYRHPPGSPKREWVSPYQAFRKRREAAKREAAKREAALRRQRREGEAERTFETWHRNDLLLLFSLLFAWRFFATLWSGDAGYTDSTLLHLIDLCSGTLLLLLLHPTLIGKAGRVGSVILAGSASFVVAVFLFSFLSLSPTLFDTLPRKYQEITTGLRGLSLLPPLIVFFGKYIFIAAVTLTFAERRRNREVEENRRRKVAYDTSWGNVTQGEKHHTWRETASSHRKPHPIVLQPTNCATR